MITFPPEYVSINYPGYFWNIKTRKLYSIKVHGELKELKRQGEFYNPRTCRYYPPGYTVSHKGIQRRIPIQYLQSLTETVEYHVIGEYKE